MSRLLGGFAAQGPPVGGSGSAGQQQERRDRGIAPADLWVLEHISSRYDVPYELIEDFLKCLLKCEADTVLPSWLSARVMLRVLWRLLNQSPPKPDRANQVLNCLESFQDLCTNSKLPSATREALRAPSDILVAAKTAAVLALLKPGEFRDRFEQGEEEAVREVAAAIEAYFPFPRGISSAREGASLSEVRGTELRARLESRTALLRAHLTYTDLSLNDMLHQYHERACAALGPTMLEFLQEDTYKNSGGGGGGARPSPGAQLYGGAITYSPRGTSVYPPGAGMPFGRPSENPHLPAERFEGAVGYSGVPAAPSSVAITQMLAERARAEEAAYKKAFEMGDPQERARKYLRPSQGFAGYGYRDGDPLLRDLPRVSRNDLSPTHRSSPSSHWPGSDTSPPSLSAPPAMGSDSAPRSPTDLDNPALRRKISRWNGDETNLLIKLVGVYGKGKWKKVLEAGEDAFKNRTAVDLKDKWRNLERSGAV